MTRDRMTAAERAESRIFVGDHSGWGLMMLVPAEGAGTPAPGTPPMAPGTPPMAPGTPPMAPGTPPMAPDTQLITARYPGDSAGTAARAPPGAPTRAAASPASC